MTDRFPADPPSSFVVTAAATLLSQAPAPRRALDLAMGRGRHALALARMGWRAFGIDRDLGALRTAMGRAAAEGSIVRAWCGDLTVTPLPAAAFELVVVTRYLQRDLFPSLRGALRPGGHIVYETFTVNQRALGTGPTSSDHLLEPGELDGYFNDWTIRFSEEVVSPEAVARIVARKP